VPIQKLTSDMLQRDSPRAGPHFFSRPLEDFGGKASFIITDLIQALDEQEAVTKEGIFRLSAPKHLVEALSRRLDQGRISDWSEYADHNLLACAFKAYIRELSIVDPLIGRDIADEARAAVIADDPNAARAALRVTVAKSPKSRRNTLACVMKYLKKVMDSSEANLMSSYNLAVCFTPCLFERSNAVAGEDSMKVVEEMIVGYDAVFPREWTTPWVIMTDEDIEIMAEPEAKLEDVLNEQKRRQNRAQSLIPYPRDDLPMILHKQRPVRPPPPLPGA
jgi:hypothetical protein